MGSGRQESSTVPPEYHGVATGRGTVGLNETNSQGRARPPLRWGYRDREERQRQGPPNLGTSVMWVTRERTTTKLTARLRLRETAER